MKKRIKKAGVLLGTALLSLPLVAFAGRDRDFAKKQPDEPVSSVTDVFNLLSNIFTILYSLFFAVAAFFILYGGFLYLTAGGDSEKVGRAKNLLIYAAVAIAIAIVSLGVDNIVLDIIQG